MTARSSSVSGPGLSRMASGTPILPMSCNDGEFFFAAADPQLSSEGHGVDDDAARVAFGFLVAGVQRGDERVERVIVRGAEITEEPGVINGRGQLRGQRFQYFVCARE